MSAKLAKMRGLARIRKLQAEMERAAVTRALGAVAQVEATLRMDEQAVAESKRMSRAALGSGYRYEWLLADAQSEVAQAGLSRMGTLLQQRQVAAGAAMSDFLACRRQHEQAKALEAAAQREVALGVTRRDQAEADDWVLSRWSRAVIVNGS